MKLHAEIAVEVPDEVGQAVLDGQAGNVNIETTFSQPVYVKRGDGEWTYQMKAPLVWEVADES